MTQPISNAQALSNYEIGATNVGYYLGWTGVIAGAALDVMYFDSIVSGFRIAASALMGGYELGRSNALGQTNKSNRIPIEGAFWCAAGGATFPCAVTGGLVGTFVGRGIGGITYATYKHAQAIIGVAKPA